MDRALFDFGAVRATGRADADGDLGFDADPTLERELDAAETIASTIPVDRLRAVSRD
jgi:hypothetical protein